MPVFTPISQLDDLPAESRGYERFTLDLKAEHAQGSAFERAKDMAAFANHLGGSIVIGIPEVDGQAGRWKPLEPKAVNAAERDYSQALSLCHPPPVMTPDKVAVPGGTILAINVWPYPAQVVAVRLSSSGHKDFGGDSYVFPLRTSTQTTYLRPENLPMFMEPRIRRVVILLSAIKPGSQVHWCHRESGPVEATFDFVDHNKNVFSLNKTRIPLELIEAVYEGDGGWQIMLFAPAPVTA